MSETETRRTHRRRERAAAERPRLQDQPALPRCRRPQGPGQGRQGQRHRAVLRAGVPARPVRGLRRRGHHPGRHRHRAQDPRRALRAPQRVRAGQVDDPGAGPAPDHRQGHRHPQREGRRLRGGVRQPRHQGRASSSPPTIKAHPKLLVGGVWCICDIEYFHSDDPRVVPWILGSIKPIQLSNFDFEQLPRRPARVHHRRVDRPAHAVHRLQPRDVRPAGQAHPARAAHPVRRAQLQPRRARPQGHRQVPHLLRVLASRHAHLRRRGHRPEAVRQQLPTGASAWSATGTSSPSTSSPARRSAPTGRSSTS